VDLPKSLTTVTTLSKIVATVLFVTLPLGAFYLGIKYQKATSPIPVEPETSIATPTFKPTIPRPSTDSTTGWKTFNNGSLSFEVPLDFQIATDDNSKPSFGSNLMSFNVYVDQVMGLECGENINSELISVDGIKAHMTTIRGIDCGTGEISQIVMSLDKDKSHYAFVSTLKVKDEQKAKSVFKQIIDTFEFID